MEPGQIKAIIQLFRKGPDLINGMKDELVKRGEEPTFFKAVKLLLIGLVKMFLVIIGVIAFILFIIANN